MNSIIYPEQQTWFIASTGNIFSHGKVEITQCMGTGLENMETFDNVESFEVRCSEVGIILEIEEGV